jgi:glycosyltransferase involved in cell wall biosynthesis
MDTRQLVDAAKATLHHILSYPIVLLTKKPRVVHIHTTEYLNFWESTIYVVVSRLFSKKIIVHIHAPHFEDFYDKSGSVAKTLVRSLLGMADRIIVLSSKTELFFQRIVYHRRISVISNATEIPSTSARELVSNRNIPNHVSVLFVGGEEAKRKGFYDILKAIPAVTGKCNSNILFIFAGKFDMEKQKAIHEAETLYHCVKYLGFLEKDEMLKVRLTSDIYILPSYAEGLPIAMLEAMASELPVISTGVGSIPELIENGVNGFLIKPGDFAALAEKIVNLANEKTLRRKMGKRNVEKIRRFYSLEHFLEELNKIYANSFGHR